tara:strand:+ start:121 stop:540 length:420 start_codon:yes stop_codon:yes gene_type:complete
MKTTTKENHALNNAINHMQDMVENYEIGSYIQESNVTTQDQEEKLEEIRESILNSALSVEFRSGWCSSLDEELVPEEFKILLSWGGPALRIIGDLDQYKQPENIKMQFQDWGTLWTDFEITEDQTKALNWFCNCFYFGD